jgi:superfamily II DNA or RNA helicase
MVFIDKQILYSQIIGLDKVLKNELRALLSYEDKGYIIARMMAKRKYGYIPKAMRHWDGKTYLLDKENKFPTGMLNFVLNFLKNKKISYEFISDYSLPETESKELKEDLKLWPHQNDALQAIKTNTRGMVRAATGYGKTKLSIKTCQEIGAYPFLFIVHRISLLEQTHKEYSRYFDEPIGWIGDGIVDVHNINIASIATLCSILKIKYSPEEDDKEKLTYTIEQIESIKNLLNTCQFMIVDELHHSSSSTFQSILKKIPNAPYRIGLSATPFRTDGTDILLEASFGPIIYTKTASELIQAGYLTKPKIYFIQYKDYNLTNKYPEEKKGKTNIPFNTIYKDCMVENIKYNNIVAKTAYANVKQNRLTLVSVKQIKHGEAILKEIKSLDNDLNVVFLHGGNKKDLDEEQVKKDFANRKIDILISTLLDEGVDIPCIEAIVDAGGGRSPIKALQLVGRAIRNFPGKKFAYVYMFMTPYTHLWEHSLKRIEILKSEPEYQLKMLDWKEE